MVFLIMQNMQNSCQIKNVKYLSVENENES